MTLVIGVLNVTPDSFSDGGAWLDPEVAIRHGLALFDAGADIIDVGGESTRPGARRIGAAEEQGRVLPVIEALAAAGATVSVDTMNAETARSAVAAGATIINDVSGGYADPALLSVAAETGVTLILSHWRGHSATMDELAVYHDVVAEVSRELSTSVANALAAGVRRERIVLDPGLGFAKTAAHNWQLLAEIDELEALGLPMMIGASRKRFLADLLAPGADPSGRDLPTAVLSALMAQRSLWAVRVHDVAATRIAIDVVERIRSADPRRSAASTSRDRIRLIGLEATGHHGVFDFERRDGQRFIVDLDVSLDLARAAASDDVADTLHYGELADKVVSRIESEPVGLIETLAESIASLVLDHDPVRAVTVTVHKPGAPITAPFEDVSVTVTRRRPLTRAVIALGGNLGDREANLARAMAMLSETPDVWLRQRSGMVESPALRLDGVDYDAPRYLNAVVAVDTRLSARGLLRELNRIESALGRVRDTRWGDRTLDLDIITFGDARIHDDLLTIPHPRAGDRAFVLVPWLEVDPRAELPGIGPVAALPALADHELVPWPRARS
jgi:dihydropteroate synthase/2-amino-4-hydroxy-6-hydroxymethyldihydropteridine diphosphokinase/dihydroneopterin aldolase